jgi:hypothetical protein
MKIYASFAMIIRLMQYLWNVVMEVFAMIAHSIVDSKLMNVISAEK